MNFLILTCNTGQGHNSAAAALAEEIEARGGRCETKDALRCLSATASKTISTAHEKSYLLMPNVWKRAYEKIDEKKAADNDGMLLIARLLGTGAKKLSRLLTEGAYDAVLCVHPFAAVMLTAVREKIGPIPPAAFICTDYACPPTAGNQRLPFCCIPHEDARESFTSCGIPDETIRTTGIPVRQVFHEGKSREEARRTLGVPEDCVNVVLMCGSMGCGPMEKLAQRLAEALPANGLLTVCCGTNKKLLSAVEKLGLENVRALGFTQDVPLWMDSADLFITKPGGLSITEAACRGVPLLLMNIVFGCETPNYNLFLKNGYAEGVAEGEDVAKKCALLLDSPVRLDAMRENQRRDFTPSAARRIVDLFWQA